MWPTDVQTHTKLYDMKEEMEKMAKFISCLDSECDVDRKEKDKVQLISVPDGINAPRKAHVRFTPSLRSFPNVFETVPMFV